MVQKNTLWGLVLSLGIGLSLVSCHDSEGTRRFSDKKGGISPRVELNTSVISSKPQAEGRAIHLSTRDLALKLTSADGSYSKTWESVEYFDPTEEFSIGEYTMEAYYGNPEEEGINLPAYYGSTTFTIVENQSAEVSLSASLINSMISVEYSDRFKDYMASWNAELHTGTGKTIYYGMDQVDPVYVKPGNVSLDISFSKPNGQSATLRVETFQAKPRYHYHIKVDIENEAGGTNLMISFDQNLNKKEVKIDLSDELFNAAAPTIEGNNIENGGVYSYIDGNTPERIDLTVIAKGGVDFVRLETNSIALNSQSWNSVLELGNDVDEAQQSILAGLGLDVRGLFGKKAKLAALDFTDVAPHLFVELNNEANDKEEYHTAEFTVRAYDVRGLSHDEPFTFTMKMLPLVLNLTDVKPLKVAATELELDVEYNGDDLAGKVTFEVEDNGHGTWNPVGIKDVKSTGENKYHVVLTIPESTHSIHVRAHASYHVNKIKYSDEKTAVRNGIPQFTVSIPENDIWAKKANVVLSSSEADAALLAKGATYYLSTDNGIHYAPAEVGNIEESTATLVNLTPGTTYMLKVGFGSETVASAPVSFTTEAAAGVPNGDFEDLHETFRANKRNQGGKWSISSGIDYQTTNTFSIKEPTGWISVNPKTMNGTGPEVQTNTWFAQPAVFNTSLTWTSTVPGIKVFGTGAGTDTPPSFKDFKVHKGSNAMAIRNVKWSDAGQTPGVWLKTGISSDEYYNHNEPKENSSWEYHYSVGRMLLGSSYTYNDHSETYDEGVSFTSRPTALKGWYYLLPCSRDNHDQGIVYIKLYNGTKEIAAGSCRLPITNEYTQFNCPIRYHSTNPPKATSLRIRIESSLNGKKGEPSEEHGAFEVDTYMSRYESYYHGATLVVDDFTFEY